MDAIRNLSGTIWGSTETLAAIPQSSDTHTLIDGDAFELDGVQWNVIELGHYPGQLAFVLQAGIVSADNVAQVGTILVPSDEGDMTAPHSRFEAFTRTQSTIAIPHGPVVSPEKLLTHYTIPEKGTSGQSLQWTKRPRRIESSSLC